TGASPHSPPASRIRLARSLGARESPLLHLLATMGCGSSDESPRCRKSHNASSPCTVGTNRSYGAAATTCRVTRREPPPHEEDSIRLRPAESGPTSSSPGSTSLATLQALS